MGSQEDRKRIEKKRMKDASLRRIFHSSFFYHFSIRLLSVCDPSFSYPFSVSSSGLLGLIPYLDQPPKMIDFTHRFQQCRDKKTFLKYKAGTKKRFYTAVKNLKQYACSQNSTMFVLTLISHCYRS